LETRDTAGLETCGTPAQDGDKVPVVAADSVERRRITIPPVGRMETPNFGPTRRLSSWPIFKVTHIVAPQRLANSGRSGECFFVDFARPTAANGGRPISSMNSGTTLFNARPRPVPAGPGAFAPGRSALPRPAVGARVCDPQRPPCQPRSENCFDFPLPSACCGSQNHAPGLRRGPPRQPGGWPGPVGRCCHPPVSRCT